MQLTAQIAEGSHMDWQKQAISDLKKLEAQKSSLENIKLRIQHLRLERESPNAPSSTVPVAGGASKREDKLLNSLVEEELLRRNYRAAALNVMRIENALKRLSETERTVLDRFFINRVDNHVEILCEELGYEVRSIYNIKNKALHDFTICLYVVRESA